MTLTTELNTIYLPVADFPELFTQNYVIKDGHAPVILDAVAKTDANNLSVEIFIPKWVNIANLLPQLRIFHKESALAFTQHDEAHFTRLVIHDVLANDLSIQIGSFQSALIVTEASTSFDGTNCAILICNQNTAEQIADWLNYHRKTHNLQSAIIIDRGAAGEDSTQCRDDVIALLSEPDLQILWLPTHLPLGKPEPSEKTLWMCPSAPGKDKFTEPPMDPWHSEMDGNAIIEIVKSRYLAKPRAVLKMQVSDFLPPMDKNIFDIAKERKTGFVPLIGQNCFPWRVRPQDQPRHGDHACVIFSDGERSKAWALSGDSNRFDLPWQLYRVGSLKQGDNEAIKFWRAMALRHIDPDDVNATLAPKTSLVRENSLIKIAKKHFGMKPVDPPAVESPDVLPATKSGRRLIVTTMKNEGPFLLEWIAYHRAIGFDDIIVFTNDCEDGTDDFFDLLHDRGIVEHRKNPYREVDMKPQHAALYDASNSKLYKNADWKICMDVDEYINIKIGDGKLDDLFGAVENANMIALTWRLFGNAGIVDFKDAPIMEQFNQAAPHMMRFPHQAWGIKTLYRDLDYFKKMGVHRPKGLRPERMSGINWVNGSGKRLPESFYRNSWRTGTATVGYDLVELNHYAVRSMESFLVKRDRGRVNHVDRDQGMNYWFRMNHNVVEENSIKKRIPLMQEELDKLMSDPDIAKMHHKCVDAHRKKIDELKMQDRFQEFFDAIKSSRMQELSKHTNQFGMNVFLIGPECIDDAHFEKIRSQSIKYFNVNPEGKPFQN